jgi:hypothetical protein
MTLQQSSRSFALCVEDDGMEDLEARKVYQVVRLMGSRAENLVATRCGITPTRIAAS